MKKIVLFLMSTFNLERYKYLFEKPNKIYNYMKYIFLKVIEKFLKYDDKLIVFSSYSGQKYDDSPKEIYEYLINSEQGKNYKYIWAFIEPEKFNILGAETVKVKSFKFYIMCLKSRYLICNSVLGEGFYFKGKKTTYINTWHGTAIKKIGKDRNPRNNNWEFQGKHLIDIMLAQSEYDAKIFSRTFNIPREKILITGLPRNDKLINVDKIKIQQIKEKLGLNLNKKIILYAPTYRNYELDDKLNYIANSPVNFEHWHEKLGDDYIILFRAHYYISKVLVKDVDNKFVIDVSNYPSINELLIVSDILVSDYSSLFFDYSIMEKPMICFAYDISEYTQKVGIYLDLEKEMPGGVVKNEEELLERIKMVSEKEIQEVIKFRSKYIDTYGEATKKVVQYLVDNNI